MKKKVLSLALILSLILSAFPTLSVSASGSADGQKYRIAFKDGSENSDLSKFNTEHLNDMAVFLNAEKLYFDKSNYDNIKKIKECFYKMVLNPNKAEYLYSRYYRSEECFEYDWSDDYVNSLLKYKYATVYESNTFEKIFTDHFNFNPSELSSLHRDGEIFDIDNYTYGFYYDGYYYVSMDGGYGDIMCDISDCEILEDLGSGKYLFCFTIEWMTGDSEKIYITAEKPKETTSDIWKIHEAGADRPQKNINERGFDITRDGWAFPNSSAGFNYGPFCKIPVERYTEVFGEFVRPLAERIIDRSWSGNCFGMCALAYKIYQGRVSLDNGIEVNETYDDINSYFDMADFKYYKYPSLKPDSSLCNLIERYQVAQETYIKYTEKQRSYAEIFKDAEKSIANKKPLALTVKWKKSKKTKGHELITDTSRDLVIKDNGWRRLYLYDPNNPHCDNKENYILPDCYKNWDDRYIEYNINTGEWYLSVMTTSGGKGKELHKEANSSYSKDDYPKLYFDDFEWLPDTFDKKLPLYCVDGKNEKKRIYLAADNEITVYDNNNKLLFHVSDGKILVDNPDFRWIENDSDVETDKVRGYLEVDSDKIKIKVNNGSFAIINDGDINGIKCGGDIEYEYDSDTEKCNVIANDGGDITVLSQNNYDSDYNAKVVSGYLNKGETFDIDYNTDMPSITTSSDSEFDVTEMTEDGDMQYNQIRLNESDEDDGLFTTTIKLTIGEKTVYINGDPVKNDVAPVIKNNRTLLPIRIIAENLGASVGWNDDNRSVYIMYESEDGNVESELDLKIGDSQIEKTVINVDEVIANLTQDQLENGVDYDEILKYAHRSKIYLDTPAEIINDRTYMPVRAIAEALGASVEWNDKLREVTISKKEGGLFYNDCPELLNPAFYLNRAPIHNDGEYSRYKVSRYDYETGEWVYDDVKSIVNEYLHDLQKKGWKITDSYTDDYRYYYEINYDDTYVTVMADRYDYRDMMFNTRLSDYEISQEKYDNY